MVDNKVYATGRRKTSVARVFLLPGGTGKYKVNKKDYKKYFPEYQRHFIDDCFIATNTLDKFDIYSTVKGGGFTGQSQALRHGIARALDKYNREEFHKTLKLAGYLTRDDRMVERKRFGYKKSRKKEQYSKR